MKRCKKRSNWTRGRRLRTLMEMGLVMGRTAVVVGAVTSRPLLRRSGRRSSTGRAPPWRCCIAPAAAPPSPPPPPPPPETLKTPTPSSAYSQRCCNSDIHPREQFCVSARPNGFCCEIIKFGRTKCGVVFCTALHVQRFCYVTAHVVCDREIGLRLIGFDVVITLFSHFTGSSHKAGTCVALQIAETYQKFEIK